MNPAFSKKTFFGLGLIILLMIIIFSPAFFIFFSADDFYNMRLVMGQNFPSVLTSFLFTRRADFLFYRPLTTQLYFYTVKSIFGLNPNFYHGISFLTFFICIFLVYRLAFYLTKHQNTALLTTFFYGLTPSNITRLGWVVQIQELAFGLFTFAACLFWLDHLQMKRSGTYLGTVICFILALMSKESAVILPALFLLLLFVRKSSSLNMAKCIQMSIPIIIILIIYLTLRFWMGVSTGQHYFTSFNLKSTLNTFLWYTLLGLGVPEILLNYTLLSRAFQINPSLIDTIIHTMPIVGIALILFLILFVILCLYSAKEYLLSSPDQKKMSLQLLLLALGFFSIGLLPHLFSPWHKFAYELTVPMFGLSLALGFLTTSWQWAQKDIRRFIMMVLLILLGVYSILSFSTTQVEVRNHWVFRGGKISQSVLTYFQNYYSGIPDATAITFIYDGKREDATYGLLKQVPQSLAEGAALQLFYNKPDLQIVYRDRYDGQGENFSNREIVLSSRKFVPELLQ